MEKLKSVVVLKTKGVSKLKMRPLEKIRLGRTGTLTACNDEILRKSSVVWTRSTTTLSDLVSLMHSYGRFGHWIL